MAEQRWSSALRGMGVSSPTTATRGSGMFPPAAPPDFSSPNPVSEGTPPGLVAPEISISPMHLSMSLPGDRCVSCLVESGV